MCNTQAVDRLDTHLFGFRRGLVPYHFEFGNRRSVFLEVIKHEKVSGVGALVVTTTVTCIIVSINEKSNG
jgi:hypothetical protein